MTRTDFPAATRVPAQQARWARTWPPLSAIAVAVGVWWLCTGVLPADDSLVRQFAPHHVLPALGELTERGVLASDIGLSLRRLLVGLLIAVVLGIPAGLLIGLNSTVERATTPLVQFLRMISPLSWAPIAVALFGIGDQPVIFLIAAASVWPVILTTAGGVRAIDQGLLELARSFHATRLELLTAVILPAIAAHVQTGVRVALGVGWVVLVPAEMLGVRSGLGYQILNARDQLAYDQVVAVIVVIGVLGSALDWLTRRALGARDE